MNTKIWGHALPGWNCLGSKQIHVQLDAASQSKISVNESCECSFTFKIVCIVHHLPDQYLPCSEDKVRGNTLDQVLGKKLVNS